MPWYELHWAEIQNSFHGLADAFFFGLLYPDLVSIWSKSISIKTLIKVIRLLLNSTFSTDIICKIVSE